MLHYLHFFGKTKRARSLIWEGGFLVACVTSNRVIGTGLIRGSKGIPVPPFVDALYHHGNLRSGQGGTCGRTPEYP